MSSRQTGRENRQPYYELRLQGLDTFSAGGQLGLPQSTRSLYERWFRAERPEAVSPRDATLRPRILPGCLATEAGSAS